MEPVTHALSGLVLSKLISPADEFKQGSLLLLVSSMAPDIDSLTRLAGIDVYLRHHRGLTHSVVLAPLFALSLVAVCRPFTRDVALYRAWLLCLLGLLVHMCLDWVNSYGTQLLYPFSLRRYALDLDVILDLYVLVPLILGYAAARMWPENARLFAALCLSACVLALAGRAVSRRAAAAESGGDADMVLPDMQSIYNPFTWKVLSNHGAGVTLKSVNIGRGVVKRIQLGCVDGSAAAEALSGSSLGTAFIEWSRAPCLYVDTSPEGGRVVYGWDLRFDSAGPGTGACLLVEFGPGGNAVRQEFKFQGIREVECMVAGRIAGAMRGIVPGTEP